MFMTKRFSMTIMRFQLCLFIWSQVAETLEEQLTDLGQNVTINCDLDVKEVYWVLLKLPDPPVMILRSFSSPFHYSERFKHIYSIKSKHNLFINNVTHDELGVYYCMNTGTTSKKFSNGTRLHVIEPTSESQIKQNIQWVVIMSGLMNGVLIIVVIGLLKVFVSGSKSSRQNVQHFQDADQSQYAEVTLPTPCKPIHFNSTYALVQQPKPQT